jgi:Siphovirus ReqiPepy6 Gp37-like protein
MDIFILDPLLRPIDVVDEYVSFIWTERWDSMGDFELVTVGTPNNRRRFVADTKLSIVQSKRVMIVESIEETDNVESGTVLKAKGRCLNIMLEKRLAVSYSTLSGSIRVSWDTYGWTPTELLVLYFFSICYWGDSSAGDIIPFIQEEGSLYPAENIPDPWPGDFEWSTKPMDLYTAMRNICTAYDIGFRFYKDPNASKLYFEATMGCDRTSQQTDFPPVIFSQDMANLIDTTEFTDYTKYFNAIFVVYFYKDEFDNDVTMTEIVKAAELDFSEGGFDQKVKLLSVTQIPEDMDLVDVPAYLIKLGEEELGRNLPVNVYDGEIAKNSTYVYEVDYNLGDIVEVRGNDGGTAYMRVVEQIFKSDNAGEAAYPSLITKSFVNPGTWASWKYDVEWSAMGSEEYWSNQ